MLHRPVAPGELDALVRQLVVGQPTPRGRRLLGLEYERLILDSRTGASAPLDFCREFLLRLVDATGGQPVVEGEMVKGVTASDFDLSMEPGGQLEVASPPFPRLDDIDGVVARSTEIIEGCLRDTPFELVCLGHAPVTPVESIRMLPRKRYEIMNAAMPARGPLTRNMMRATAGFQITYDVVDADDASAKLALLYRLSPVLMSLAANSRRIAGKDSGFESYRHHVWWETDSDRSGVPAGCLQPSTALQGYIDYAMAAKPIFLHGETELEAAPDATITELAQAGRLTEADVDLHLTGLFPFVRLRNYIELRCFDSVDWPLARSVMALVSGLVYCDHAFAAAFEASEILAIEDPEALRRLHEDAARRGMSAELPDGRTFAQFAEQLIGFASSTLGGANCDWAQPSDLDAVRARI